MAEVEIGRGKSGRRAYGFDDIAIVPSRRTRDPEDVDISWEIDAFRFELPLMASAMDGVVSPATAIEVGRLGGVGVLNLEGLWTRYEDPEPLFEEISHLDAEKATGRMQEIYGEPIKPELITQRIREIKEAGVVSCASLTPQRTELYAKALVEAELDLFVIQGTVVSAEHVSKTSEPLNLKRFIREFEIPVIVGGCASYQAALHLMRTGAVGVLVGVGTGPRVHHPRRARDRGPAGHGDRRRPGRPGPAPRRDRRVRAGDRRRGHGQRGRHRQGHRVRRGRGHDRFAARRRGRGAREGLPLGDGDLPSDPAPRGAGADQRRGGTLKEILVGPAHENDGRLNLFGALRTSMATCGYESVKEFQKAEVMVAPALQTEGKSLQRSQGVGMGH